MKYHSSSYNPSNFATFQFWHCPQLILSPYTWPSETLITNKASIERQINMLFSDIYRNELIQMYDYELEILSIKAVLLQFFESCRSYWKNWGNSKRWNKCESWYMHKRMIWGGNRDIAPHPSPFQKKARNMGKHVMKYRAKFEYVFFLVQLFLPNRISLSYFLIGKDIH